MMHVALLTNIAWLDDELPQFQPLVVGLIDEQVRVAQVVPGRLAETDTSAFGERIAWQETKWAWLNRYRLASLAKVLERSEVDLLHAMDSCLWPGALALARVRDLPVALNVNSAADVDLAERAVRSGKGVRVAFAAATNSIGKALNERLGPDAAVHVLPPGAHVPTDEEREQSDGILCAIVVGDGHFDSHYEQLLNAIAMVLQENPEAQFFFDGQESDQHRIWREASKRGLLSNLSMAPRRLGHRELLMRADVIIQPQALGRARSLTIQAMAHGLPVLAHPDPWLDYIVADETAWLANNGNVHDWTSLIQRVINEPGQATALGAKAQKWIAKRHIPAKQVALTISMYRRLTGEAFKFSQAS